MFFFYPYVQMLPNWSKNLHDTQTQQILNIYYWNFLLDNVGGCKSMWKVHSCGTTASNCKATQNNGFKICRLIWVGTVPFFEWGQHFVIWRWSEWRFNQKANPNLISKLLPLKITIDIPITISYIIKLQCLKFGLWVVTSNMQTSIPWELSKKKIDL